MGTRIRREGREKGTRKQERERARAGRNGSLVGVPAGEDTSIRRSPRSLSRTPGGEGQMIQTIKFRKIEEGEDADPYLTMFEA